MGYFESCLVRGVDAASAAERIVSKLRSGPAAHAVVYDHPVFCAGIGRDLFCSTLLALRERGVDSGYVTLHVGAGTFQPMRAERLEDHTMHREWLNVGAELVEKIRRTRARGGRVVAVGTTVVRALESSLQDGEVAPFAGETQIFIFPGYRIASVDALVTNFHLPESTLLMLVSAFAGREFMLEAYRHAVEQRYRFFSYGDAMLIWPQRRESGLGIRDSWKRPDERLS